MQYNTVWWILFAFVIVFLILLIILLTGSSFQLANNLTNYPVTTLGGNTSQVLFQNASAGPTYQFVFRPRPTGSTVRLWNTSSQSITLYNDLLNAGADTVQIGASDAGVLPNNRSTLCINQNGTSSGNGTTGSWRCTEPQEF